MSANPTRLTQAEIAHAAIEGVMRGLRAMHYGRRHRHDVPEPDCVNWNWEINAALAEYLVSKVTDLRWRCQASTDRGSDVGPYEVRHTEHRHGHLIVYADDSDAALWVLVAGPPGDMAVVGWCTAEEAKRAEYWTEPPRVRSACYWVPQAILRPLEAAA